MCLKGNQNSYTLQYSLPSAPCALGPDAASGLARRTRRNGASVVNIGQILHTLYTLLAKLWKG